MLTKSTDRSGKHSDETKIKISEKIKGDKNPMNSEKNRKKVSEMLKKLYEEGYVSPAKGKPKSEEHRKKIGDAQKGKIISDETRRKNSETRKNKYKNGYINPRSKKVINTETGIIYTSAKQAWESNQEYIKILYDSFKSKLNGNAKNDTSFKYL
jgi:Zn-dependent metalloprotease